MCHLTIKRHIQEQELLGIFQSGYRAGCSTHLATLVLLDGILRTFDGHPSSLILLNLMTTFHTIDTRHFLDNIKSRTSIGGVALKWFESYLIDCSRQAKISQSLSDPIPITYIIPLAQIWCASSSVCMLNHS